MNSAQDLSVEPAPGESPAAYVARLERAAKRRATPCGDGEMVWREWGEGPPLVLLHGGSGSWLHWIRNFPVLARRFRVIAGDLPGLGDSAMPPRPFSWDDLHASVAMLADVVCEGLERLLPAPAPYRLIGFSLGSIVGGHVAARESERIERLYLVATSALGIRHDPIPGKLVPLDAHAAREEQLEAQRANLDLLMLGSADAADDLAVHTQLENVRRARIRTHPLAQSDVLARVLDAITCPVELIWGDRDIYAHPDVDGRAAYIRERCPDGGYHLLEGGGHWVMYECAEAFNEIVERTAGSSGQP